MTDEKIDFVAWEEHFIDHLLPLFLALPTNKRGTFYTTQEAIDNYYSIKEVEIEKENFHIVKDIQYIASAVNKGHKHRLIVIPTLLRRRVLDRLDRKLVSVEHGTGQRFNEEEKNYSSLPNLYMAFVPNKYTYNIMLRRYPHVKCYIVGSPIFDQWADIQNKINTENPTIAISFHFDRNLCSETKSAFEHQKDIIPILQSQTNWNIIGHGHPRMMETLEPYYQKYDIPIEYSFDKVIKKADLYICDNSSTMYYFAAIGKPVIVLNAPWYRRNVKHGMRFWEYSEVGINCNNPSEIIECVEKALEDTPEQQQKREKAVKGVLTYTDNKSTERVIDILLSESKEAAIAKVREEMPQKHINFCATEPHYVEHLLPIYNNLPKKYQGNFYVTSEKARKYAEDKGFKKTKVANIKNINKQNYLVMASLLTQYKNHNVILLNHGIGQSYFNSSGEIDRQYAGGKGRGHVKMFLHPNSVSSNKDKARYPNIPNEVVGSPRMDKYHSIKEILKEEKQKNEKPIIALSFHHSAKSIPETKSAFEHYTNLLRLLAKRVDQYKIIGHGHPKTISTLSKEYKKYGIPIVEDFEEVLNRADLYICDNSTTLYDFASMDMPVIVLNAPWYRRDIEHGIRFWQYSNVGIQCEKDIEVIKNINKTLEDPVEIQKERRKIVNILYPYRDGKCGERAAKAIVDLLEKEQEDRVSQVIEDYERRESLAQ